MGFIEIKHNGRIANSVHYLAGGKHSFAHSLACAALSDNGIINFVPFTVDSSTLIEVLKMIFKTVEYDITTHILKFSKPIEKNNVVMIPSSLLDKSRNIYCLIPAILKRSKALILGGIPRGCEIGKRPTDWYIDTLKEFGVDTEFDQKTQNLTLTWKNKKTAYIRYNYPTMTGTVVAVAAAACVEGESIIEDGSYEPSCDDQIDCLKSMGGKVNKFNNKIKIFGDGQYISCNYDLTPDRIHAVTLSIAALLTKGSIELRSTSPLRIPKYISFLKKIGVEVKKGQNFLKIAYPKDRSELKSINIKAGSEPLFSSDWVPFAALLLACRSSGESTITDNVFPRRFQFVDSMKGLGMDNIVYNVCHEDGRETVIAKIFGNPDIKVKDGCPNVCHDIRGSAAILLSTFVSSSKIKITDDFQIRRGYEDLGNDLKSIGIVNLNKEN